MTDDQFAPARQRGASMSRSKLRQSTRADDTGTIPQRDWRSSRREHHVRTNPLTENEMRQFFRGLSNNQRFRLIVAMLAVIVGALHVTCAVLEACSTCS